MRASVADEDIPDTPLSARRRWTIPILVAAAGIIVVGGVVLLGGARSPQEVAHTPTTTTAPSTSTTTVPLESPVDVSGDAPAAAEFRFPAAPWPDPEGDPPWMTVPVGLPGTTHLRIGYGSLGFISLNNVERGAVVRLSPDGAVWRETAILRGPDGEEQVSVRSLVVSKDEYLVVGQTWTNTDTGSENFRESLWRSRDGVEWTVTDLAVIDEDASAAAVIPTARGLMLAGTVSDDATGVFQPTLWIESADGSWSDITFDVAAFAVSGWIEGAADDDGGMIVWGSTDDGTAVVWHTPDLRMWTRATLPDGANGHIIEVTAFRDGYVAVGGSKTWISADAIEWTAAATAEDFATDAASDGVASFRQLYVQDGFLVAVAAVGYHAGVAWCYADAEDCRQFPETVLVSQDAEEWRRLRLPGELDQPDHPIEIHAVLADGRLTVLHTVGDDAVLSTLVEVVNSRVLDTGDAPDLPFPVVEPGDVIAIGVTYAYPIYTHCGFPTIGPFNGAYWVAVEPVNVAKTLISGWGSTVYGFIELRAEDQLSYIVDDQVVANYRPDPDAQTPGFCI